MTQSRRLGPYTVAPIGVGAMGLSHAYGVPPSVEAGEALLKRALDLGVNHFDTAALYGFGRNETLVGRVLGPRRNHVVLASKGGLAGVQFADGMKRVVDGRPEAIRRNCEDSLVRLGTDHIDLYYLHRWDKRVPIEDCVGEMARLKAEGKIGALGLSEVSAPTLRRAHAVHPIAAVQMEYSLWSRNPEIAVLGACRELGAALVAFSPVARGFLSGRLRDVSTLEANDTRRAMPRFAAQAYATNSKLLEPFLAIAARIGCTPAQLAIAWVLARGENVIALSGSTQIAHLEENLGAAGVQLDPATIAELDTLFAPGRIVGARYGAQSQADIDTEEF